MATAVSQHVGRYLGFFKNVLFRRTLSNFLQIGRKHIFAASNRNVIINRVEKKKSLQILSKR